MRFRYGILTLLALGGCTHGTKQVEVPTVVQTVVTRYVPVDDDLTAPCPIEQPKNRTVKEAVRVANARKLALQKCNVDKAAIRGIQGKAVPAKP